MAPTMRKCRCARPESAERDVNNWACTGTSANVTNCGNDLPHILTMLTQTKLPMAAIQTAQTDAVLTISFTGIRFCSCLFSSVLPTAILRSSTSPTKGCLSVHNLGDLKINKPHRLGLFRKKTAHRTNNSVVKPPWAKKTEGQPINSQRAPLTGIFKWKGNSGKKMGSLR